ncbi:hypothetical protein K440DRAFT_661741 [Wilcoxina mikolae CBS 423.85]|nr:hypothetical protein K440DRAFT_661741 [Wilcoxina mikolae CBS 423.85]
MIEDQTYTQLTQPSTPHPVRVVLGRGTQNYTCATTTSSSVPVANGAKADLYDASCLAQNHPDLLHTLPAKLLDMNGGYGEFITKQMSPYDRSNIYVGYHIFPDQKTPVFHFKKPKDDMFVGKKLEGVPAPMNAKPGKWGAVDWLLLGATSYGEEGYKYKSAYRVVTAGGKPPKTCEGMEDEFEVPYASEYWFYE